MSAPMSPFKALGAGREQGCESLRRAGAPRPMRGRHRVRPTAVPRRRLSRLVPENKTPAPASLSFQSASGVGRAGLQGLRCSNGRCSNGHSNRWSRSEIIMRGMYGFITDQASGIYNRPGFRDSQQTGLQGLTTDRASGIAPNENKRNKGKQTNQREPEQPFGEDSARPSRCTEGARRLSGPSSSLSASR